MSGVAIVRELLAQYTPLTALVPAEKIRAGVVPQMTDLPAVGVHTISQVEDDTLSRLYPQRMLRERVQVTVYTKDDYVMLKRIMKVAMLGRGVHTGLVKGYMVRSVIPWGTGPDIPPGDDRIYEQSRDFMVTFVEAN